MELVSIQPGMQTFRRGGSVPFESKAFLDASVLLSETGTAEETARIDAIDGFRIHHTRITKGTRKMLKQLWMDEAGFVVSAELAIVLTLGVLAMVIGIHSVAKAVTAELGDFANAIGVLDQTYSVGGLAKGSHGSVNGAAFADRQDLCDCSVVTEPDPTPKIDASSGTVESG